MIISVIIIITLDPPGDPDQRPRRRGAGAPRKKEMEHNSMKTKQHNNTIK